MTLEEALAKIEELQTNVTEVTKAKEMLENEKSTLNEFKSTYEKEKEGLTTEIDRLKQANMHYFERLNFENHSLTDNVTKETKTPTEETKTITMEDLVSQIII